MHVDYMMSACCGHAESHLCLRISTPAPCEQISSLLAGIDTCTLRANFFSVCGYRHLHSAGKFNLCLRISTFAPWRCGLGNADADPSLLQGRLYYQATSFPSYTTCCYVCNCACECFQYCMLHVVMCATVAVIAFSITCCYVCNCACDCF